MRLRLTFATCIALAAAHAAGAADLNVIAAVPMSGAVKDLAAQFENGFICWRSDIVERRQFG